MPCVLYKASIPCHAISSIIQLNQLLLLPQSIRTTHDHLSLLQELSSQLRYRFTLHIGLSSLCLHHDWNEVFWLRLSEGPHAPEPILPENASHPALDKHNLR